MEADFDFEKVQDVVEKAVDPPSSNIGGAATSSTVTQASLHEHLRAESLQQGKRGKGAG